MYVRYDVYIFEALIPPYLFIVYVHVFVCSCMHLLVCQMDLAVRIYVCNGVCVLNVCLCIICVCYL